MQRLRARCHLGFGAIQIWYIYLFIYLFNTYMKTSLKYEISAVFHYAARKHFLAILTTKQQQKKKMPTITPAAWQWKLTAGKKFFLICTEKYLHEGYLNYNASSIQCFFHHLLSVGMHFWRGNFNSNTTLQTQWYIEYLHEIFQITKIPAQCDYSLIVFRLLKVAGIKGCPHFNRFQMLLAKVTYS